MYSQNKIMVWVIFTWMHAKSCFGLSKITAYATLIQNGIHWASLSDWKSFQKTFRPKNQRWIRSHLFLSHNYSNVTLLTARAQQCGCKYFKNKQLISQSLNDEYIACDDHYKLRQFQLMKWETLRITQNNFKGRAQICSGNCVCCCSVTAHRWEKGHLRIPV